MRVGTRAHNRARPSVHGYAHVHQPSPILNYKFYMRGRTACVVGLWDSQLVELPSVHSDSPTPGCCRQWNMDKEGDGHHHHAIRVPSPGLILDSSPLFDSSQDKTSPFPSFLGLNSRIASNLHPVQFRAYLAPETRASL